MNGLLLLKPLPFGEGVGAGRVAPRNAPDAVPRSTGMTRAFPLPTSKTYGDESGLLGRASGAFLELDFTLYGDQAARVATGERR